MAAFEKLMALISPKVVVDCPFGTGRWIEQYDRQGWKVFGVDLSQDMLGKAAAKITPERRGDYTLMEGSIFDFDFPALAPSPDVFVCVRFVNWLPFSKATEAIRNLRLRKGQHLLIGNSVVPTHVGPTKKIWMRGALLTLRAILYREPPQYVHSEAEFLQFMTEEKFTLVGKEFVFRNPSRENYFYLFTRSR